MGSDSNYFPILAMIGSHQSVIISSLTPFFGLPFLGKNPSMGSFPVPYYFLLMSEQYLFDRIKFVRRIVLVNRKVNWAEPRESALYQS